MVVIKGILTLKAVGRGIMMEEILTCILNNNSIIIDIIGIITAIFPLLLGVAIIIRFIVNMQSTLLYKIFKFPKNIYEYKHIKNILKVLGYICIQLFLFFIIITFTMLYYFIYYGMFLPKIYGVETLL